MVRPMRSGTNRPGPSHSRATGPTPRPAAERDFRASRSDPVTLRCGAHAAMDYAQSMRPVAVAVMLAWPDLGPPPPLPPRDVRLFCGPDIDGDGERDAIVRLAFDNPDASQSTIDAEQLTYTWLASKHAGTWRALGRLTADVSGARDHEQTVVIMRRPTGQTGIENARSSFASETGCRITGYEIMAWRAGALATGEAGDRSPKCAPCGCNP